MSDIPGCEYFTVRLDGKNFSKLYKQLQKEQIYSSGYSLEYESTMQRVCEKLTIYFTNVHYSYTHSDEITLLFSPAPFNDELQCHEPHLFNGRHDKIISLTASLATHYFCKMLVELYIRRKATSVESLDDTFFRNIPIATFDARIARYKSLSDAFQMIIWRSYDYSVNSVSTAIRLLYSEQDSSAHKLNGLNTTQKALVLHRSNLLSQLTEHLKYGTLFYHGRYSIETGAKRSKRSKTDIQVIPGQIIINIKERRINMNNE